MQNSNSKFLLWKSSAQTEHTILKNTGFTVSVLEKMRFLRKGLRAGKVHEVDFLIFRPIGCIGFEGREISLSFYRSECGFHTINFIL